MIEAYYATTDSDGQRLYWCRFFWDGSYRLGYLSEASIRDRLGASEEDIQRIRKAFERQEAILEG